MTPQTMTCFVKKSLCLLQIIIPKKTRGNSVKYHKFPLTIPDYLLVNLYFNWKKEWTQCIYLPVTWSLHTSICASWCWPHLLKHYNIWISLDDSYTVEVQVFALVHSYLELFAVDNTAVSASACLAACSVMLLNEQCWGTAECVFKVGGQRDWDERECLFNCWVFVSGAWSPNMQSNN